MLMKENVKFICKSKELFMNNRIKINLTIINEIIICSLYNPLLIDESTSKLLNQRLLETLTMVSNTRMIKIDILVKKYNEVNTILDDFLYLIDPRLRFKYKKQEEIFARKAIIHSVFIIKLKIGIDMMNEFFNFSFIRNFRNVLKNLENHRKLRYKILLNSVNVELIQRNAIDKNEKRKMTFNNAMKKFYLNKKQERINKHNCPELIKEKNDYYLDKQSSNILHNLNFDKSKENRKKSLNPFNKIKLDTFINVEKLIKNITPNPKFTKIESQSTGSSHKSPIDDLNKSIKAGIFPELNNSTISPIDWINGVDDSSKSNDHNNIRNSKSLDNKSSKEIKHISNLNKSDLTSDKNNLRVSLNKNRMDPEVRKSRALNLTQKEPNVRLNSVFRFDFDDKFLDFDIKKFDFDKFDNLENSDKMDHNFNISNNFQTFNINQNSNKESSIKDENFDKINNGKFEIYDFDVIKENPKDIIDQLANFKYFNKSEKIDGNDFNIFRDKSKENKEQSPNIDLFNKTEKTEFSNINSAIDQTKDIKRLEDFILEQNFISDLNKNTITTMIKKVNLNYNHIDPSMMNVEKHVQERPSFPSYDSVAADHSLQINLPETKVEAQFPAPFDPTHDLLDIDLTSNYKRVLDKKEDVFNPAKIKNDLKGSLNVKLLFNKRKKGELFLRMGNMKRENIRDRLD